MRQLVLINDASHDGAEALARRIAEASLPDLPVVVFSPTAPPPQGHDGDIAPAEAGLTFAAFDTPDHRRIIVADHAGGVFPKDLSRDVRQAFAGCDILAARCPPALFQTAVSFYDPLLFALTGVADRTRVLSATSYLVSAVDRFRNLAARRRHDGQFDPGAAPIASEALRGGTTVIANAPLNVLARESLVFETFGDRLPEEAARLGFQFQRGKVRRNTRSIEVLPGETGIAMFGPYAELDAGRYHFRLGLASAPLATVRFVLEAAWGGGAHILASDTYTFEGETVSGQAILAFEVDGDAIGQAFELRLWSDPASAAFSLTSLSLTRVAP